jgi:hypothetical protein
VLKNAEETFPWPAVFPGRLCEAAAGAFNAGGKGTTGGLENAIPGPLIPAPLDEETADDSAQRRCLTLVVPPAGPQCAVIDGKSVFAAFPAFLPLGTNPGISGMGIGSSDSTIATSSDTPSTDDPGG